MSLFLWIIGATFAGSLVSLIGRTLVFLEEERLRKYTYYLISFAIGSLLGVVFLDVLPEAVEIMGEDSAVFAYVLLGFVIFFILEKLLFLHHCHGGECPVHASGYLILIGDGIHNFIDGIIIALAFLADFHLGIITAFAVIMHEAPQEISDFLILLSSGFSRAKALFYNFLIALMSVVGAMITYFAAFGIDFIIGPALGMVAGHFLYISASDLVPELHMRRPNVKATTLQIIFMIFGILVIKAASILLYH